MKIWTRGSSPRSRSRNAWKRIKNVNGASRLSNFWNFFGAIQLISCRDWWPWTKPGYITMTRRQSNNQWSGGVAAHPAPKNSECKNSLESSRLDCLGSKRHPSQWLSSKWPTYQRAVLISSAGAIERHFEGKTPREVHQGCLVVATQCHGSPTTCNPEETGLPLLQMSWSPTLFSGSGPVGVPPVPWAEKKQLKARHFSSDAEVIVAAETWLDGQPSEFFSVACKS